MELGLISPVFILNKGGLDISSLSAEDSKSLSSKGKTKILQKMEKGSKSKSGVRLLLDFCQKVDFKVDYTRLCVGILYKSKQSKENELICALKKFSLETRQYRYQLTPLDPHIQDLTFLADSGPLGH